MFRMKNLLQVLILLSLLVASSGFAQNSTNNTINQSTSKIKKMSLVSEKAETISEEKVIKPYINAGYIGLVTSIVKIPALNKVADSDLEFEYEYEFQESKNSLNNISESTEPEYEYEYEYEYETAEIRANNIFDNSEVEYEVYTPNSTSNISDGIEVEYVYE